MPFSLTLVVLTLRVGIFVSCLYLVCDHLCLVRIVKYAQHHTTTLTMTSAPALLERRAPTVADAAPALARGPRPLPSPEAVGGVAR